MPHASLAPALTPVAEAHPPPSPPALRAVLNADWPCPDGGEVTQSPLRLLAMRGWHEQSFDCQFKTEEFLSDHPGQLTFSQTRHTEEPGPGTADQGHWHRLFFELSDGVLLALNALPHGPLTRVQLWAQNPQTAREQARTLQARYGRTKSRQRRTPYFYVLKAEFGDDLTAQRVPLPARHRHGTRGGGWSRACTDDELALHYGDNFPGWHRGFLRLLRGPAGVSGLSILRGEPGTGKTSYLRRLVWLLRATHRVYFLPVSAYELLSSPAAVNFWTARACRAHDRGDAKTARLRRVVILEDAEGLMLPRGADNRERLANLLNIADGFMGDLLRLHVICTVNTPLEDMDPALLRPGRLLAYRHFRRLNAMEAQALARAKSLSVTGESDGGHTLAELYAGEPLGPREGKERAAMGFAR